MAQVSVTFQPIVDKCEGCGRVNDAAGVKTCQSYSNPGAKWRLGECNFATHIKREIQTKVKINPLKASKRATGAKKK